MTARRLKALRSYARKQSSDLEQARLVHARRRSLQEHAERSLDEARIRVQELETQLRREADPDRPLSLDSMQRGRLYLSRKVKEMLVRSEEREQSVARATEAAEWLSRCAQDLEATKRLAERTRVSLAAEQRRRSYREADELWLANWSGRA